ncbi:hypothetical protein CsatA_016030 [Cannabis sativa]
MKLERESVFGHISPGHKPDSKLFDYNNISLESTGLKSQSITKEGQNRPLCDFKDNEKDAAQLIYLMNDEGSLAASKVDCFNKVDDINNQDEYEIEEFAAPFTKSSLEIKNGSNYYTDKSVMECELPELQVCYKESGFSSVKDICIDEGVPSQDKFLFGNGENKKDLCTFVFPDADENEQHSKEHMDIGIPSSIALKSSVKNQSEKEFVVDCESKDLMPRGEVKCDAPSDKIFPEDLVMMRELCIENLHSKSSSCDGIASVQVQTSSDNASETTQMDSMGSAMAAEKLDNNIEEESEIPSSLSAAEESSSSSRLDNQLSNNSKKEKGSSTGDFDSLVSAGTTKEECSHNGITECLEIEDASPVDDRMVVPDQVQHNRSSVNVTREEDLQHGVCGGDKTPNTMVEVESETSAMSSQQELATEECSHHGVSGRNETTNTSSVDERNSETQNVSSPVEHVMDKESPRNSDAHQSRDMPMFEDGTFGAHTVSGQFHYSHGESSFSAAGPMSGRINYSGPIPYSGSVSLRSDSSTTSTRSFAFPVLQSEWNSSPVRMAKADRRRFRKDKGWRQGLLCCRF